MSPLMWLLSAWFAWWLWKELYAVFVWLIKAIMRNPDAFEITDVERCHICQDYQHTEPLGAPLNIPVCHDCALQVPINCWETVSIYD